MLSTISLSDVRLQVELEGNELKLSAILPVESDNVEDIWLTPAETAKRLDCTVQTVALWAARFDFPHNGEAGKSRRYHYPGVCKALAENGKTEGGQNASST